MKAAEVELYRPHITGNRKDLDRGIRGILVFPLAVGRYTRAWGACGPMAKPLTSGSGDRVVVARPANAGMTLFSALPAKDRRAMRWEVDVIAIRVLMSLEEYQAKHAEVEALERDMRTWRQHRDNLIADVQRKVEAHLALTPVTDLTPATRSKRDDRVPLRVDLDRYWKDVHYEVEVRATIDPAKVPGLADMLAELEALDRSDPSKCDA